MTAAFSAQRKLSLKIDAPLYSLLEKQADENGEGLNDLIQRLLADAMDEWCDYCNTLKQLSAEDDRPLHVCVGK